MASSAPRQRGEGQHAPVPTENQKQLHDARRTGSPSLVTASSPAPTTTTPSRAPAGSADCTRRSNHPKAPTEASDDGKAPTVADTRDDRSGEDRLDDHHEHDQEEEQCLLDMDACFKAFDKDEDGFLSQNEFAALCRALFRNDRGKPYPVESSMLNTIFTIFDTNKDHVIDKEEFRFCWQKWIKAVVRPVSALIVVDVQNDFISGSLALINCPAGHHGEEVIPPINRLLNEVKFDMVVYSLDWHPEDHVSFIDNVKDRPIHHTSEISSEDAQVNDTVIFDVNNDGIPMEQRLWPRHCVQKSWGAQLHDDLKIVEDSVLVYKGTDPDTDSYSVFWDNNKKSQTSLNEELQKRNITDVYICGIAYDVCVSATTAHAIEEGYRALLIDDGCRGVCDADIQATKERTTSSNGLVIHSSQVKSLVSGRDRPPVLAYKLALEISKKMKKK
ncbi:uncharacterized protein Naam [Penaeus vannamei]|uniref:uncharacterized protein Naam n=2 Tax=Penaeus vannamei TaxID=6689 RepID=UPI00387F8AF1